MATYQPKSKPAQEIGKLMGELNTAQHNWNTYAARLGSGYTMAFQEHETAIKKVSENYRLAAESAYWVLSLLCVSFAGGLAGGLMAPWVGRAGSVTARTMLSETTQSGTQSITQKGLEKTKPSEPEFRPVMKSPLLYYQDMVGEIGICFSDLRNEVEEWMQDIDKWESDRSAVNEAVVRGYGSLRSFLEIPLLKDYPKDNWPVPGKVAREVELGMWIAWANVRDIDYWKTRIDTVSDKWAGRRKKGLHMDDLRKLQPVVERLQILDAAALGTRTVEKPMVVGSMKETFLDITRLRLPVPGGGDFLAKVADVVKDPRKVLGNLAEQRPSRKDTGRPN